MLKYKNAIGKYGGNHTQTHTWISRSNIQRKTCSAQRAGIIYDNFTPTKNASARCFHCINLIEQFASKLALLKHSLRGRDVPRCSERLMSRHTQGCSNHVMTELVLAQCHQLLAQDLVGDPRALRRAARQQSSLHHVTRVAVLRHPHALATHRRDNRRTMAVCTVHKDRLDDMLRKRVVAKLCGTLQQAAYKPIGS